MPAPQISGFTVAYTAIGGIILWSGIVGTSLSTAVKDLLSGKPLSGDTEPISTGTEEAQAQATTDTSSATGGTVSGAAIAQDALKYQGHKYVYGGPSNPTNGWDCSSFVSYILGHDFGLTLPGGTWATATSNGNSHGPAAAEYLLWSGASTISRSQVQAGDLLVWETHVGFAADSSHMISAYDTQQGTLVTAIDGAGPTGEILICRRVNATTQLAANANPTGAGISAASGPASTEQFAEMGEYFQRNGYSTAAAAGIVGCIAGESDGDPEATGDGGVGLIGFTPASTLSQYGGTIGGNPSTDLANQLSAVIEYNNKNWSTYIPMLNAQTSPVQAADFYSQYFLRPQVADSDVRAGVAESVYSALQNTGTGVTY